MKSKQCDHKIVKAENDGHVCCRCGKEAVLIRTVEECGWIDPIRPPVIAFVTWLVMISSHVIYLGIRFEENISWVKHFGIGYLFWTIIAFAIILLGVGLMEWNAAGRYTIKEHWKVAR